ncbi:ABC transporter permease subunit [Candidatus Saccharibacteria bacterium]|jgi:ABC-type transport system involved in multi-copper enzyme maturation permease subunit|nr:ABC transporter permease subunit [Candidatus Saccharibacteria bacterium]
MMNNLFLKTLFDKKWFTIGWATAFAFMSLLVVIFYPSFNSSFQVDQLTANFPSALKGLIGDAANLKNINGYLAEQLFNIRIPLFILIMSIVLGLGLSITDEESGRLRTLVATPIGRTKILLQKQLAGCVIVCLVSLATIIATYIGLILIHEQIPNALIWELFVLSCVFGSVTVGTVIAIGFASGSRGPTTAIAILITIGSFILSTFGIAVSWLKPYEKLSLLHYYDATGLVKGSLNLVHILVLFGILFTSTVVAILMFRNRDIH